MVAASCKPLLVPAETPTATSTKPPVQLDVADEEFHGGTDPNGPEPYEVGQPHKDDPQ